MKDYMKEKKIETISDLPVGISEPLKMMNEMIELLPLKISKVNAKMHEKKKL